MFLLKELTLCQEWQVFINYPTQDRWVKCFSWVWPTPDVRQLWINPYETIYHFEAYNLQNSIVYQPVVFSIFPRYRDNNWAERENYSSIFLRFIGAWVLSFITLPIWGVWTPFQFWYVFSEFRHNLFKNTPMIKWFYIGL